jgi:hypothetical protein
VVQDMVQYDKFVRNPIKAFGNNKAKANIFFFFVLIQRSKNQDWHRILAKISYYG